MLQHQDIETSTGGKALAQIPKPESLYRTKPTAKWSNPCLNSEKPPLNKVLTPSALSLNQPQSWKTQSQVLQCYKTWSVLDRVGGIAWGWGVSIGGVRAPYNLMKPLNPKPPNPQP